MGAPRVVTFGCRLNAFESEVIRERMVAAGIEDAVVVNTCTVTAEAERQARQMIRKLRRENPRARILVTGCAAQLGAEKFAAMPEVDAVIGNIEKLDAENLRAGGATVRVADPDAGYPFQAPSIVAFGERTRAFLQIQQGCAHSCTFCIVPRVRGPNRSADPDTVVGQVRDLVEAGHPEVVLTGIDICSYGRDRPGLPHLGELAAAILAAVPDLRRLRLSTLDPGAIDVALYRLLAEEERFMPHLHLSLQAADDLVLKRMRRRHLRGDALAVAERARAARPDVTLGADLIAGFPTESEAAFANTLAAVDDMGLTFLHVFPYSPRPDTPGARMPQVPVAVRRERAALLRAAGEAALGRYLTSCVGRSVEILTESDGTGRTRHYAQVKLDGGGAPGEFVSLRVSRVADGYLVGSIAG